jgi:leucyl/phenylalanyl-tRNA--protein transferase
MFDSALRAPAILDRLVPGRWPDPTRLSAEGLGGIGGDLAPQRLLSAYDHGYFPCYGEDTPRLWWSPDPRAVFLPGSFHPARRLVRRLREGSRRFTIDGAFARVVVACGERRDDGRWILPEIAAAYTELHRLGHAHSFEVWRGDELIGGAYGVRRGALFCAESMFHRETDASKLALWFLLESLFEHGVECVDAQYPTPHLASLGCVVLRRREYLGRLAAWTTVEPAATALAPARRFAGPGAPAAGRSTP